MATRFALIGAAGKLARGGNAHLLHRMVHQLLVEMRAEIMRVHGLSGGKTIWVGHRMKCGVMRLSAM